MSKPAATEPALIAGFMVEYVLVRQAIPVNPLLFASPEVSPDFAGTYMLTPVNGIARPYVPPGNGRRASPIVSVVYNPNVYEAFVSMMSHAGFFDRTMTQKSKGSLERAENML
jgi:hypothetical protein